MSAAWYAIASKHAFESDWCAERTHLICTRLTEHSCSDLSVQLLSRHVRMLFAPERFLEGHLCVDLAGIFYALST